MRTALIVEDLPDVRDWLIRLVRETFADIEVHACESVAQALAALRRQEVQLALVDLGLGDGSGVDVVRALREKQPQALSVVVTIYDDDEHLFPALQAGAFGYLLKEQPKEQLSEALRRITQGEPPLSPSIARRVIAYFARQKFLQSAPNPAFAALDEITLTEREQDVLMRVAKGFTLPEIAQQLGLSRHTIADHVKTIYRKLNVSSRAEAALEAARRGLVRT